MCSLHIKTSGFAAEGGHRSESWIPRSCRRGAEVEPRSEPPRDGAPHAGGTAGATAAAENWWSRSPGVRVHGRQPSTGR
jgi:hypothetical protein